MNGLFSAASGPKEIAFVNCCLPPRSQRQLAPPQGIMYLCQVLRQEEIKVSLLNLASEISPGEFNSVKICDLLCQIKAKLIGLSVWDSTVPSVVAAIRMAKQRRTDATFILGGPAASTIGKELMARFPWIDAVVQGEGESAILSVIRYLSSTKKDVSALAKGVFIRAGTKVLEGAASRPQLNGERIPIPNYTVIDETKYGRAEISMSRGCAHRCKFCSVNSAWGKGVRFRNLEDAILDIHELKKHENVDSSLLHVLDDSFMSHFDKVTAFCRELKRLSWRQHFTCYARIDDLSEERLDYLIDAGCRGVFIGLEAPRLKGVKGFSKDEILRRIGSASDRINVFTSMIWGDPSETRGDFEATISLAEELFKLSDRVAVNLFQLAPLSGTFYCRHYREPKFDKDTIPGLVYPEYLPGLNQDPDVFSLIEANGDLFPAFYRVRTEDYFWKKQRVDDKITALLSGSNVPVKVVACKRG